MTSWVSFAIGLVLVGAGALSIYFGAPVIQLERGWAEVISGSVLLAGGCVTLAIAGVQRRLGAIERVLRADRHREVVQVVRSTESIVTESYEPDPTSTDPIGRVPAGGERSRQGLWKRARRSSRSPDDRSEPAVEMSSATVLARDLEPVVPVPPVLSDKLRGTTSWSADDEARESPPDMRPSLAAEETEHQPGDILDGMFGEPESPGASEAGSRTVVGRYQAGEAEYVMYSDGTIDVISDDDTVRHFASMSDLKAHINEQEASGS